MKRIVLFLAMVLLLIPSPSVFAESTATEVKPDKPDEDGFHFDITAKVVEGGMVEFRVEITQKRKWATFVYPRTVLGIAKIFKDSHGVYTEEIGGGTDLPQDKNDKSITCIFTVPEKSLENPNVAFVFTNAVERVRNGKVELMPSLDIFYVRLKDYYKKQP